MRHPRTRRLGRAGRGRDQEGSAYLIALMVLVLVTMLGLSLVFSTQTEMIIGANDRLTQRAFYAAETGIAVATARALVSNDKMAYEADFNDNPDYASGIPVRAHIAITPVLPIADPPCAFCEINNVGTYNDKAFFKVNHTFTVRATLLGPNGEVITAHTISDNIEVQPWQDALPPADGDLHKTEYKL